MKKFIFIFLCYPGLIFASSSPSPSQILRDVQALFDQRVLSVANDAKQFLSHSFKPLVQQLQTLKGFDVVSGELRRNRLLLFYNLAMHDYKKRGQSPFFDDLTKRSLFFKPPQKIGFESKTGLGQIEVIPISPFIFTLSEKFSPEAGENFSIVKMVELAASHLAFLVNEHRVLGMIRLTPGSVGEKFGLAFHFLPFGFGGNDQARNQVAELFTQSFQVVKEEAVEKKISTVWLSPLEEMHPGVLEVHSYWQVATNPGLQEKVAVMTPYRLGPDISSFDTFFYTSMIPVSASILESPFLVLPDSMEATSQFRNLLALEHDLIKKVLQGHPGYPSILVALKKLGLSTPNTIRALVALTFVTGYFSATYEDRLFRYFPDFGMKLQKGSLFYFLIINSKYYEMKLDGAFKAITPEDVIKMGVGALVHLLGPRENENQEARTLRHQWIGEIGQLLMNSDLRYRWVVLKFFNDLIEATPEPFRKHWVTPALEATLSQLVLKPNQRSCRHCVYTQMKESGLLPFHAEEADAQVSEVIRRQALKILNISPDIRDSEASQRLDTFYQELPKDQVRAVVQLAPELSHPTRFGRHLFIGELFTASKGECFEYLQILDQ